MNETIFKGVFTAGLIIGSVIRSVYGKAYRRGYDRKEKSGRRKENPLVYIFMALWGIAQLIALVYVFSGLLGFADYRLPDPAGWCGVCIYAGAVWLLWRSHVDLGGNWSPLLEIQKRHELVTKGVYRRIRHPMYAAHWLWVIAQPLLLQNWIAGLGGLISLGPVYFFRVGREETMLTERFGDAYRDYKSRTGRILPRRK